MRTTKVLHWAIQQNCIAEVERLCREVTLSHSS